jgi:hypothetical protein
MKLFGWRRGWDSSSEPGVLEAQFMEYLLSCFFDVIFDTAKCTSLRIYCDSKASIANPRLVKLSSGFQTRSTMAVKILTESTTS